MSFCCQINVKNSSWYKFTLSELIGLKKGNWIEAARVCDTFGNPLRPLSHFRSSILFTHPVIAYLMATLSPYLYNPKSLWSRWPFGFSLCLMSWLSEAFGKVPSPRFPLAKEPASPFILCSLLLLLKEVGHYWNIIPSFSLTVCRK